MTLRAPGTIALFLSAFGMFAACASSHESDPRASALATASTENEARALRIETRARANAVLARFGTNVEGDARFEPSAEGMRAIVGTKGKIASVTLPRFAHEAALLADDGAHVTIAFRLANAASSPVSIDGGVARYAAAIGGGDLFHRVSAAGTEDYVVFEHAPKAEELVYDVDVARVAGLRLVTNTLEFLDAAGVPRLRVAPPYIVDAAKNVHDASIAIEGCRYDTHPAAPQDRAVVPPGASHCAVHVTWSGASIAYPAIVDPSWSYTHPMVRARTNHASALLPNGQVLIYGGILKSRIQSLLSTCELYDPVTDVFTEGAQLPIYATDATATSLASGKVLIVAGDTSSNPPAAYLYNASTGVFDETGGPPAHGRVRHSATRLHDGRVLVAGGHDLANGTSLGDGEIFDPAGINGRGSFTTVSMSTREYPQSTLLTDGRVLITGGEDATQLTIPTAEIFDPKAVQGAGIVVATGAMTIPRTSHTASPLPGNKALVCGGTSTTGDPVDSCEIFDPTANSNIGAFAVTTFTLSVPRARHSATTLISGEILLVSGSTTGLASLASSEIYDPAASANAGLLLAGPPLQSGRPGHSATLLASGDVLVTGGETGAPADSLNTAERMKLSVAGVTCTLESECVSGSCNNGVCCATTCEGTCKRCLPGTGACVTVTSTDDSDTCTGPNTCSATGECKGKNAGPCKVASDCASNFCVDGVCCDSACDGQCEACDIAIKPGTCGAISATPHGSRPACAIGSVCDGQTRNQCTKTGATCGKDGHTSESVDGQKVDCAPFNCDATGACLTACASVADCAAPYACSFEGACVAPSTTPGSSNGGCSAAPLGAKGTPASLLVALGGLALFGMRRGARRRTNDLE